MQLTMDHFVRQQIKADSQVKIQPITRLNSTTNYLEQYLDRRTQCAVYIQAV